jgi:lipoprotein signal peptidase
MHQRRAHLGALAVTVAVVVADQVVKAVLLSADSTRVVHNRDAAFGLLRGPVVLMAIGSVAMLALLLGVVGRWATDIGISPIPVALLAGGLLANLCDRLWFGAVRDYLSTPWVVINLADLFVLAGVAALGIALAWRLRELRMTACSVVLDTSRMRPVIVCDAPGPPGGASLSGDRATGRDSTR